MKPHYADDLVTLYHGDCLDVLRELPDASVDAVVTDPPYGLEFMGKDWDAPWKAESGDVIADPAEVGGFQDGSGGNPFSRSRIRYGREGGDMLGFQAWCELWAAECLRVLKPGGHLLAFGGSRTWHRLACAIEDAGFEVRDSIAWMYGSGFPKSLDVSKAIDKAAGAEREVVGIAKGAASSAAASLGVFASEYDATAPATPDAAKWQGWGTALKPAHEPIVVARKPLIGTVAANVLAHGTGALNIDGCRIGIDGIDDRSAGKRTATFGAEETISGGDGSGGWTAPEGKGRWPANVVLDEHTAALLDEQSGVSAPKQERTGLRGGSPVHGQVGMGTPTMEGTWPADPGGGASRFFYTAKAASDERPKVDGIAHPTVKPLDLMRWLVRLVTPPGGIVLEPFAGSGTTLEACVIEGFQAIGIEREADYIRLIEQRLTKPIQPDMFGGAV
jgi:DNA modification methylase